jgi:Mg-chelatase subunit ChlD
MRLSFIFPLALVLLALLPLFWAFALATHAVNVRRLGRWRWPSLLVVRSLLLLALVLALAGTQIRRPVDQLTTVFLVDGSDSLAPAQREEARAFINEALAAKAEGNRAAVVVFGENALVERAPASFTQLDRLSSSVAGERTNIADALQLGLALLPAESQGRLVLLSDGGENLGRAFEATQLATARSIPVDTVTLSAEQGPDVLISALSAPAIAREGQDVPLTIRVESGFRGPATLQLFADGELVGSEAITLEPGETELRYTIPSGEAGFRRFEARIEAPDDTQALNNRAAAFTEVEGPPRVLLLASEADRALPLQTALEATTVRVELRAPLQIAADPLALRQYAAVILVDTSARAVPPELQGALASYVRDQGGSLAMIGGLESFGAGGWRRSPLAEVLPVDLDPRSEEERPDLALALVIDRSGSMADSQGGVSKLNLAKEAVYQATLGLERSDQLGVVAFDDLATVILPMQPLPDILALEDALGWISDGGGTNIRSGVEEAAALLGTVEARVKHVILLTDGLADSNYADLIRRMRDEQVTITIVSMGQNANPALRQIAALGGGEFYAVTRLSDVPSIFLAETVRVARRDIVEETFSPAIALDAAPVRGLGGFPPLYGYNATEARASARTIMVTPDGTPLLASGQFGLGRSLAWTSDLKGQWARDWLGWAEFPRFAAGLVDTLLPPRSADNLALELRNDGVQAIVDLTVSDASGQPLEQADVLGRLLGPDGTALDLRFEQIGVGRYRALAPASTAGVYLAQVAAADEVGQAIGTASAGMVVAYAAEYGPNNDNSQLLRDLAALSGGRSDPEPAAVFEHPGQDVGEVREMSLPLLWFALLLLPFDVALRRLFLRPGRLALPHRRPRPVSVPAAAPMVDRLRDARDRVRTRAVAPPPASPGPASPSEAAPQSLATSASPATANGDEALASILAARQRARRKQGEQ